MPFTNKTVASSKSKCPQWVESGHFLRHEKQMVLLRHLLAYAFPLGLLGCLGGECPLPKQWVLATSLEPSTSLGVRKPIIYARETTPGVWMWRDEVGLRPDGAVPLEELLRRLSAVEPLTPQPLFLFNFAERHSCAQLNATRSRIAKAVKCSSDGVPCIEGTPDDLD